MRREEANGAAGGHKILFTNLQSSGLRFKTVDRDNRERAENVILTR